ncbi:MAG: baseplate J/gp47 family protein [Deltaproteobacteria bacterium]|nr:baseplate J/gp47 family protein [Deltaproteobacteria bacterium]MBZ0219718.1 baseplate J/gp47 family protein [Deltaproteobacteria bacterium]
MSGNGGLKQIIDELKPAREGTSQEERHSPALDPAYARPDERTIAHRILFAKAYSAFLRFYNTGNSHEGDWQPFFSKDMSVQLAVAAVQDVEYYRSCIKGYFDFLKDLDDKSDSEKAKECLGNLFSCVSTLAKQLDSLKDGLPDETRLKGVLQNLIKSQLAPSFERLISYYKADLEKPDRLIADVHPGVLILGEVTSVFSEIYRQGLSKDWMQAGRSSWSDYVNNISPADSVYGPENNILKRANHVSMHNFFTSIFNRFLKAYARVVKEAGQELEKTITGSNNHEPHYTLFLAFLRLLEYAREEMNTLTGRHLDFYYREVLRLKEKPAEPARVHLLVELARHAPAHLVKAGELFKAGKDDLGIEAFFANDRDLVVNKAAVAALKTVYRHSDGRIYAAPLANSDDGKGAELSSPDLSWHPFHNKPYQGGAISDVRMPEAEIGFAVASHYLLMAEGMRKITLNFKIEPDTDKNFNITGDTEDGIDIDCLFTAEKEWVKGSVKVFALEQKTLSFEIILSGETPPVVPYTAKTHGYDFPTTLPMVLIKLRHREVYIYQQLKDISVTEIKLEVNVNGLKSVAISNDFGPVDASKPFQPFGPSPMAGNAFIIGSKEVFQKKITSASVGVSWLAAPKPFSKDTGLKIKFLKNGEWESISDEIKLGKSTDMSEVFNLLKKQDIPVLLEPDFSPNEYYSTASRHGFLRFELSSDFGQNEYQSELIRHLRREEDKQGNPIIHPGPPPAGPIVSGLWIDYEASHMIDSSSAEDFAKRSASFFHLAPFGHAEQHPSPHSAGKVYLLPQFDFQPDAIGNENDAAEFYIGITGLKPPQNLALLFQVVDGTADPLSVKPRPHIRWSYLRNNEWAGFDKSEIDDRTSELLNSGVITFAVPRDASDQNTFLPAGMHWIKAAVASKTDSVCRLRLVAAQALEATFIDKGNAPDFTAKLLKAGTITGLDQTDASVRNIMQPFDSFGGRGKETQAAFYTRVSERLRHKERAITMWDYERLILEAFPQIHRVKCLNHTRYEPDESGAGIYNELAPGHVTIITVPDQRFQYLRDPLRPFTSLKLLDEIAFFLKKRLSCFIKPHRIHVRNPEFEELEVSCKVKFREGLDEGFHLSKIQDDVIRYLSPWAYRDGSDLLFGRSIRKSALIDFIESLKYVDYLTDFRLFHISNDKMEAKDEIRASKGVSILVSAGKHDIKAIKSAEAGASVEKCQCEA